MLIRTTNKELELDVTSAYVFIRAFNYELFLDTVHYSAYEYVKESNTERSIQVGKKLIYLSKLKPSSFRQLGLQ